MILASVFLTKLTTMKTGNTTSTQPRTLHSLKEDWSEIKAHLKKQYPQLIEDDLKYRQGKEEQLISRLQKKLGKSETEVIECLWGEWSTTEQQHHRGVGAQ